MKRPIYLDDRERDLARRAFAGLSGRLNARINNPITDRLDVLAVRWTRDEIDNLARKFEEPPPEPPA